MKNKLFVLAGIILILGLTACPISTDDSSDSSSAGDRSSSSTVYTISGTVSTSDEASPNGAYVQLRQDGKAVGSVVANADGDYTISGVASGSYTIEVALSGYNTGTIPVFAVSADVADKNLTLTKIAEGTDSVSGSYRISGTISTSDEADLSEARIQLRQNGKPVGSVLLADAAGAYTISGVASGSYTIEVALSGYNTGTIAAFEVSANVSGKNITLTLASVDGVSGASESNSGDSEEDSSQTDDVDAVSGASESNSSGYDLSESIAIPTARRTFTGNFIEAMNQVKAEPAGAYLVELSYGGIQRPYDMKGFNTPVTIVIDGGNNYLSLEGGYDGKGSIMSIPNGVTVILKDIEFNGCDTNTAPIITVENGGTLVMKDGVEISGAVRSPVSGGAVWVKNGGVFHMDGGEIKNNTGISNGGAVYITGGGFVMRAGKISGNQASNVGGVFLNSGEFIMEGGEISGNTSKNYAGGVLVSGGQFTMKGGLIKDNVCHLYGGGVFIGYYSHLSGSSSGYFLQEGGVISGNRAAGGGGGVSLRGSSAYFRLAAGEISGNLAVPDGDINPDNPIDPYGGGGVFVQDGALFEFAGGSIINNTTQYELYGGGGILAASKDGGGASSSGGVDAVSAASGGGGGSLGTAQSGQAPNLVISGGNLSGNTAGNGMGAGVYAESGNFTLLGSPSIANRVCIQYQAQAERHILINGTFTGSTVALDLRGDDKGIAFVGNWIKPILAMADGSTVSAATRARFSLGTFSTYDGATKTSLAGYTIGANGRPTKP